MGCTQKDPNKEELILNYKKVEHITIPQNHYELAMEQIKIEDSKTVCKLTSKIIIRRILWSRNKKNKCLYIKNYKESNGKISKGVLGYNY